MKSQSLTIDVTKLEVSRLRTDRYLHRRCDHADLVVISKDADYPGMERIQARVMWDPEHSFALGAPCDADRDLWIHQIVRRFAKATGSTVLNMRHVDNITYIDYKVKELVNVADMEWTTLELEVELNV